MCEASASVAAQWRFPGLRLATPLDEIDMDTYGTNYGVRKMGQHPARLVASEFRGALAACAQDGYPLALPAAPGRAHP